jgi:hypothetical protein
MQLISIFFSHILGEHPFTVVDSWLKDAGQDEANIEAYLKQLRRIELESSVGEALAPAPGEAHGENMEADATLVTISTDAVAGVFPAMTTVSIAEDRPGPGPTAGSVQSRVGSKLKSMLKQRIPDTETSPHLTEGFFRMTQYESLVIKKFKDDGIFDHPLEQNDCSIFKSYSQVREEVHERLMTDSDAMCYTQHLSPSSDPMLPKYHEAKYNITAFLDKSVSDPQASPQPQFFNLDWICGAENDQGVAVKDSSHYGAQTLVVGC